MDNDDNGHQGENDDHHGDNDDDVPVNTSAGQGIVHDDEGISNTEQANIAVNDHSVEDDQLSVDQVKTTGDDHEIPSLMVGRDNIDQHNSSCHDNNDHEDIPSLHMDTVNDHQVEEPSMDTEDTPDAVEEMFHNSVDELFDDNV